MQEKNEKKAAKDFVSGVILVLLGIWIFWDAMNMKIYNTFLDAPGFFPAIVGGVIAVLGAVLAVIGYRLGGASELKEVCNGKSLAAFLTDEGTVRVVILILFMVVYVYGLLGRVHFILATSIYLAINFFYLKATKQWWASLIIAVVTSVVVYYAFMLGFGIAMP